MDGLLFFLWFFLNEPMTDDPILAKCGPVVVRKSAFQNYLKQTHKKGAVKPEGLDETAWRQHQLETFTIVKVFEAHPDIRAEMATPEFKERVDWRVVQELAQAQRNHISRQLPTMPAQTLQTELATMRERNRSDLRITFRHIFLRKDQKRKFETVEAVAQFAQTLRDRARAGENFANLAIAHSQSAKAGAGGLVENSRLSELDESLSGLFQRLEPGDLSEVIATRTGFHIFKVERKFTPPFNQRHSEKLLRRSWQQQKTTVAMTQQLEELATRYQLRETKTAFHSPTWEFSKSFLKQQIPTLDQPKGMEKLRRQLFLAEAAKGRGLSVARSQTNHGKKEHKALAEKRREAHYQAFLENLPLKRVRRIYDELPESFGEAAKARVHIIFQPQGKDSFATQQRLEKLVAELRQGRDFHKAARAVSKDPSAEKGGSLGILNYRAWAEIHPMVQVAIISLENNQISDPIYCSGKRAIGGSNTIRDGFVIVKVEDKQPARLLPLEAVEARVRRAFTHQNRALLRKEWQQLVLQRAGFERVTSPN